MNLRSLIAVAALLVLAACSSSRGPTYSGHEESTEGVPGFAEGKKLSPYVKLGQSYTYDGETYVPRNQPDYVEEGMASWYGPGFHGGKTANGEEFDSNDLTAAHRTLPLPSIVKVTMVSTGKSAYVRINDRGPFAHSRIIDLSRAAAEKIGLVRAGVAKVRVEYMKGESERFAALLAQGRDPKSIDLASEVLTYQKPAPVQYASAVPKAPASAPAKPAPAPQKTDFWESVIPSAQAAEPTEGSMPLSTGNIPNEEETTAVAGAAPAGDEQNEDEGDAASPFTAVEARRPEPEIQEAPIAASLAPANGAPPPSTPVPAPAAIYVQLGAFQNQGNAERLKLQFPEATVYHLPNRTGQYLFHVRMGPYLSETASNAALEQARGKGVEARIIRQ